ncbi:MAG: hypothetical protein JSS09_08520 [Verrucomicrobia bacterium]|nr:hypothetical protein [Verrucomicrobiota bacterium]
MIKLALFFLLCVSCFAEKPSGSLPEGSILHLVINMNGGQRLLLNDDSLWDIDPEDIEISRLWLSPFPMKISNSRSSLYPYFITNIQSQKKVKARPSSITINEQAP